MSAPTVERVAAITATLHDGLNLIVLSKGKKVTVAKSSIPFLEEKEALEPKVAKAKKDTGSESGEPASLADLRKSYADAHPEGKKPSPKWDAATIEAKIAEFAKGADNADGEDDDDGEADQTDPATGAQGGEGKAP